MLMGVKKGEIKIVTKEEKRKRRNLDEESNNK